ncbi:MAG: aldose 1-epimerase family protein [Micrococcaceae bacterium]
MSEHYATGEQYKISYENSYAEIVELAAGIRVVVLDGVQVTETFADDSTAPMGHGLVLVPWPNRVAGGKWKLGEKKRQLDITEVPKNNAIHGLLRNTGYTLKDRTTSSVTLQAPVFPQHGYPFHLATEVTYSLNSDGLQVEHRITNLSEEDAPIAIGAHPYFRVGDTPVEDLTVKVNAKTRIIADEQMIPTGEEPVSGTYDLREGKKVSDLDIDTAFKDLTADEDGIFHHHLIDPEGNETILWSDETMPYVHIFTPAGFDKDKKAIAMEPMTAPANTFNTGENLRWIAKGQTTLAHWGVSLKKSK